MNNLIKRKKIDLIFDVGANIGQYALSLRRFGYTKKIVSFEPMKKENEILRKKSIKDNNWLVGWDTTNTNLYDKPIGLGSQNKSLKINKAKNSVSSSIMLINKSHTDVEPNSKTSGKEKIKVIAEVPDNAKGKTNESKLKRSKQTKKKSKKTTTEKKSDMLKPFGIKALF